MFRYPSRISLFCAFIGTGAHLFVVTACLLSLALMSAFHLAKRGAVLTATIIIYALSSGVGGFVSARLYRQFGGYVWLKHKLHRLFVFLQVELGVEYYSKCLNISGNFM